MELGTFSISLAVKDIVASKTFYEKLGFEQAGGNLEYNYLIMRNGSTNIGLFQGMFEHNILTFNPGWDAFCNELDNFTDVRDVQAALKAAGVELTTQADPDSKGAASITLVDPDGNSILIDQHV
ncbi:MAG: VOC family protein [Rhizobiales bacterium]|nr:VOC family protein [Hyphomicrobiales bacterium]NRB15237.1 VOC family protein [Hyphomicrobiales bacterium]